VTAGASGGDGSGAAASGAAAPGEADGGVPDATASAGADGVDAASLSSVPWASLHAAVTLPSRSALHAEPVLAGGATRLAAASSAQELHARVLGSVGGLVLSPEEGGAPPVMPDSPEAIAVAVRAVPAGGSAVATHAYTPRADDELALAVGDVVSVLSRDDDGWWLGRLGGDAEGGAEGRFPFTYVRIPA